MNTLQNPRGKLTGIKIMLEFDDGTKPSSTIEFKAREYEKFNALWSNLSGNEPVTIFVSKKNNVEFVVDHMSINDVN